MYFYQQAATRSHSSGRKWLQVAAPSEWPQVATPSEWPQVAASGRPRQFPASGRKLPLQPDFNFHTQSNPPEFYSHKGALAEIEGSGFPGSSPKLWLLHFWALNCGSKVKGGPCFWDLEKQFLSRSVLLKLIRFEWYSFTRKWGTILDGNSWKGLVHTVAPLWDPENRFLCWNVVLKLNYFEWKSFIFWVIQLIFPTCEPQILI